MMMVIRVPRKTSLRRRSQYCALLWLAAIAIPGSLLGQDAGTTTKPVNVATAAMPEKHPDLVEIDPFGGVSAWAQLGTGLGQKLVNGGTAGARVAVNISRHIGLELGYNFNVNNVRYPVPIAAGRPTYSFGNQIHYWAFNPVVNLTPRGSTVQPYLTIGVGPMLFDPTGAARSYAQLASTQAIYKTGALRSNLQVAMNYGGGVKFHLSDRFGLRFDLRYFLSKSPTFGLPNYNDGGIYSPSKKVLNGVNATMGLVFYLGPKPVELVPPMAQAPPPPAINAGDVTGADGLLCQGKPITLHSSATDPAGHALGYAWRLNGSPAGANSPDFSFTPNNAGDFKVEVAITDTTVSTRTVSAGPRTITVQDYTPPQIVSVAASPASLSCASDTNGVHTATLSSQASGSACGGALTYKWTLSEGTLTGDSSANASFDSSSLNFDAAGGQSKTVTATLTATDETGKSAIKTATIAVNCPPQFKRLSDIVFAKNSARVNNCGKRILIEQAAPQAGTAYDIVLVAHRAADEAEQSRSRSGRRRAAATRTLDEERALNAAAVLIGGHSTCASMDASQIKIDLEGTGQVSTPDPGVCGTSNLAATKERRGSEVTDADKERRVEVYLVPKNSQVVPPAAKNPKPISEVTVKALGCPR